MNSLFRTGGTNNPVIKFFLGMNADGTDINPEGMLNLNAGLIMITCFFFAYLSGLMRATTSMVVGTLLAILLDRKFFGQGFVRTLLITPFLVMPVVAGFLWKSQMFNATFGVINWVIELFGFESIEFATKYPLASVVTVLVWQWSPFMMLIVLAGLQGQDGS